MAYDLYTYGNGDIIKGILDAVAMCMNSHSGSLFEPLKALGLIVGMFIGILYIAYGDMAKALTHWIFPMAAILHVLFIPTATVWVHDPVSRTHQKVDHVPYGLAAFSGYVSKIGHTLTQEVEKIFSLPDDLRYHQTGTLFASQMMIHAKTFRITHEGLADNMRSFVGQCILYDAMLGKKYTLQDLRHTEDLWDLVSKNASPVRSFMWRDLREEGQGRGEIITCREGVQKLNTLWAGALHQGATFFGKKIFGHHALISAKAELLKYLPLSYETLGNIAKSATDILKQHMMIYAVVEGLESKSTELGNAPNFAARRAYLQQRATYETLGAMVGETLPTMKAVLEGIAYAFFIFMVPLALLPFGWKFLMRWGQVVLWLQLWAPLYAVLNYMMTMAAKGKTLAALTTSSEGGITLASAVGVAQVNMDIQAMAGYLAMSIPFLSLAILKGVGSFVHLASHLGNITQGAASTAASEISTGNLSFGNISEGNTQMANTTMLNHSRMASYKAGGFQLQDGREDIMTMADGSQIANVATSNLPISLNASESLSAQQSEMATRAYQKGLNLSESSANNFSHATRHAVQLSQSLGHMESSSDAASLGISTEQSQAIHRGANLVKDFAKQNNVSDEKAASLLGEASTGIGLGKNSLSLSGKGSLNAQEQALYQKAQKFAEDHHFQEAMREASTASKQLSHTLNDEASRRLAEDVSGSYEKGLSERHEASKSFGQSESYSTQAMLTKANSATINRNASQEFIDWMADQPAENAQGRLGHRGASHIIAANQDHAMAYAERFMREKGLVRSQGLGMSPSQLRDTYDKDSSHSSYKASHSAMDEVRTQGESFAVPLNSQVRERVQDMQESHQEKISHQTQDVLSQGEDTKQHVLKEETKGVVRRLGSKGLKEVREIGNDLARELSFTRNGESQQK